MPGSDNYEEDDLFADLARLNDSWEAQMVFHQELPMVMDETEALDTIGNNIEEILLETRDRLAFQKGKGKGEKGKGKGSARTYGQGFGGGKGSYLEHRRMLQQSRMSRGYDRPWQQRARRDQRWESCYALNARRCQCNPSGYPWTTRRATQKFNAGEINATWRCTCSRSPCFTPRRT